jgi:hypothetical protein
VTFIVRCVGEPLKRNVKRHENLMANERQQSAAWQQFLIGKREILAEYDRAFSHAQTQPVHTHHGNVAEAAFRNWLITFLPKRFGVTSGYIRSQHSDFIPQSGHFDVIIYDQLEAPTLWIEDNRDKSEGGRARIIPAEHVRAIIEVKVAFNRKSITSAIQKIVSLMPLMAGVDTDDEHYKGYIPMQTILAIVCFELRRDDGADLSPLELIRDLSISRLFYGALILRGEGRNSDDTALIQQTVGDRQHDAQFGDTGLLGGIALAATTEVEGQHQGAVITWIDINFSKFAFDLLALVNGSYRYGLISSYYGFDFSALN